MTDVLFILGAGRNGSTAFEKLLAARANTFPVGEMRFVWQRGFTDNHLCSCGDPFLSCPFWGRVRDSVFQPDGVPAPGGVLDRWDRIDRNRYIAAMHHPRLAPAFVRARFARAHELIGRWYEATARESAGRLIVDSTKDPCYAHLLSMNPALRIAYVHLVRDSRGMAHSRRRPKVRPEIHWTEARMDLWSPTRTAMDWNAKWVLSLALRAYQPGSVIRVRYEDYVRRPHEAIERVRALLAQRGMLDLGEPHDGPSEYHTVSGNPIRFEKGPLRLRLDEDWRTALPARDRAVVTALTAPFLALHKLPPRSRARARRS